MSNLDVALTLRLINQLSGPAKQAAGDLKKVATDAKALDGTHGEKLARDLGRVSVASGKTKAELRMAGTATATFTRDLDRATVAGGKLDSTIRMLGSDAASLKALGANAKVAASDLDRAAIAAGRLQRATAREVRDRHGAGGARPHAAGASAAEGGSSLFALGRGALVAAGGAMVLRSAVRATVGEAITFEKAWADVLKKVNDSPSPQAMNDLQMAVRKTAIELGIPREKVAALTAEAASAGIKFQDLERFVSLAAKASAGWDIMLRNAWTADLASAADSTMATYTRHRVQVNAAG